MIWISQHFIRVLGGARGLPGWHFLASPPPFSPFTHTPPVPFSLAPYCCLGNKAHCFSPLYACASPRAAPACCACALLQKLGWGKKKGRRDWRRERPRGAFCNRPRACTFLIPLLPFLRFPMLPTPPTLFSYIASHAPDRRAFGLLGIPTSQEGFEPDELEGSIQFTLFDSGLTFNFSLCTYSPPHHQKYVVCGDGCFSKSLLKQSAIVFFSDSKKETFSAYFRCLVPAFAAPSPHRNRKL